MNALVLLKYAGITSVFISVYLFVCLPWPDAIRRGVRRRSPKDKSEVLQKRLAPRELGYYCGAVGLVLGFLAAGVRWTDPLAYMTATLGGLAGLGVPAFIRKLRQAQRVKTFEMQLPEALELLSHSMKAGLSFIQAVDVVARESGGPVAEEFRVVIHDSQLGLSPEDALEKMLQRWPNRDLELFVIAAGVSLRSGGNLADVTASMIHSMRERFRLKGRIKTLTAQGRLSGWVVGLLPAVLFAGLFLLDRQLIEGFVHHPLGIAMLLGGALMEGVGVLFIKRVINIQV